MGEQTFLGKFIGAGGFHMGTNDQIIQGGEQVSQNFPKTEHCKSENFPQPWWETHLKIYPNQSIELWNNLSFRFMVKRFQRSSQVQVPSCSPWTAVFIYYLKS